MNTMQPASFYNRLDLHGTTPRSVLQQREVLKQDAIALGFVGERHGIGSG